MNAPDDVFGLFEDELISYLFASSSERVHCFVPSGADGGKLVWESDAFQPATPPVVVDNHIWVLSIDAHLYVLDLNDGQMMLDFTLMLEDEPQDFLGYTGNMLVFRTGYAGLHGFDLTTQQLWFRNVAFSPPAVGGGRVYCADADSALHAISASGTDLWTYGGTWGSGSPGAGTHVYRNPIPLGYIYAKVSDGVIRLTTGGQFTGKATEADDFWLVGGYAIGPYDIVYVDAREYNWMTGVERGWLYAFGFNGNTIWESSPVETGTEWMYTDPILEYPRLFTASIGGDAEHRLYAFDATSGLKLWASDVQIGADFVSDTELEACGPNLFVASQDGYLYAVSRTDGKLAWKTALKASPGIVKPHKPTSWCSVTKAYRPNAPDEIDPLWLILPHWLYVAIHKPYPPTRDKLVARIQAVTEGMPLEERTRILARARAVGGYVNVIEEALAVDDLSGRESP